jgi:hypothetical protein
MCEVEQMGCLGASGNIVVNYVEKIWIYLGWIFRSEVAGSSWWIIKSGIYQH